MLFSKEPWHVGFTVVDTRCQMRLTKDGAPALEVTAAEGTLVLSAWFSVHEDPLCLRATTKTGDDIRVIYRPYRIELYVNDVLCDEEWPWGDPCFADAKTDVMAVSLVSLPMPERTKQLKVRGSFVQAEGWRPGNGVFVGDCMPYAHKDRYHVLYLKDRHHHSSKWGKGAHQWEHISSRDLIHWDIHPMAVEIDDPMEGSICTGSWIYQNGSHILYYTVRQSDGSASTIERSISEDGYYYHKDADFRFILSEKYDREAARDPKVVRGEDGLLHMFVTTSEVANGRGALAHLISHDDDTWGEQDSIYIASDESQPECPDYFSFGGRYYLIFSHRGTAEYRISDKPFTDWKMPENPTIPCSSVPKAAIFQGRIIFTGFTRTEGYGGTMAFLEAKTDEAGELIYFAVQEMQAHEEEARVLVNEVD